MNQAETALHHLTGLAGLPADLPDSEIAALSSHMGSPYGRVSFLVPALKLSKTLAFWARPPVPCGHNAPVWP